MVQAKHDPDQHFAQLRQILSADKLSVGFFIGAGCPCAISVRDEETGEPTPLIPGIKGLTEFVDQKLKSNSEITDPYARLLNVFEENGEKEPTVETMLKQLRALRAVAGTANVRGLSAKEIDRLDASICGHIRDRVTRKLPSFSNPYHSLANFVGRHLHPHTELFTSNYDLLIEQALERWEVPFFDGFVGSARPFFDQRAIEDDEIPARWSRVWKVHGSINWRYNRQEKIVVRSEEDGDDYDELLIHPSHMKYDESRRMPYYVMIDRLKTFLRYNDKPVALIVLGYSFGDDHLNEVIIEGLKANPSSACFALQYDNLSDYKVGVDLAKEIPNLTFLAADGAVVRGQEAPWIVRVSSDLSSIAPLFEELGRASEAKDERDEEAPIPCLFKGGHFGYFGDFLDHVAREDRSPLGR